MDISNNSIYSSETQARVELLEIYRDHPVEFIKDVLNIELDEQQIEIVESLYKHKKVTVRSGKGPGKTYVTACVIFHFLITRFDSRVVLTAPSETQLKQTIWPNIAKVYNNMNEEYKKDWELSSTSIKNKKYPLSWFCATKTARRENPESLYGAHDPNLLYIIEEASGVPNENFYAINATLTEEDNYLLILGNPNHISGFFYDTHLPQNADVYKQIHMSCYKSNFVTQKSIDDKLKQYGGKNTNGFRIEVLGEFPTAETSSIILPNWVRSSMTRTVEEPEGDVFWGIDIGGGKDLTILIKRQGNKIFPDIIKIDDKDMMKVVGKIVNEYNKTPKKKRPKKIFIDSIAIGKGPADRLRELNFPIVNCNSANKARNKRQYENAKAESWYAMADWFRDEEPDMPNDTKLAEQLYTVRGDIASNGRQMVEKKLHYRKRNNDESPDLADALSFTFWQKGRVKATESLMWI